MIKLARATAIALVVLPILAACGRASSSSASAPSLSTLFASRLTLKDVTPITGDSSNWWDAAPTFDVRPLNSATRDDADSGGLTIRFAHLGTNEMLTVNYEVWSSTRIASALMSVNKLSLGNGDSGPKAGDQALYYTRRLAAGPTVYNNIAYVRIGQTIISIVWSHVEGYATTRAVGSIASKTANRLKDGIAHRIHPSPQAAADPLLLAPAGPQLTLLGTTTLPVEVLAQVVGPVSSPGPLVAELHQHGVTDFVFGDYALNLDTRMEVLTLGLVFPNTTTGGVDFVDSYLGGTNGVGGGYDTSAGQYLYGVAGGTRAVLIVCKSSVDGEEAARACEAPMAVVADGWHQVLR